jgi:hypothetical protein
MSAESNSAVPDSLSGVPTASLVFSPLFDEAVKLMLFLGYRGGGCIPKEVWNEMGKEKSIEWIMERLKNGHTFFALPSDLFQGLPMTYRKDFITALCGTMDTTGKGIGSLPSGFFDGLGTEAKEDWLTHLIGSNKGTGSLPSGFFEGLGPAAREKWLAHLIGSNKGIGNLPSGFFEGLGPAAREDWLTHLIGRDNPSYHLRRLPMLVFEGVDGDMIKRVSAIIGTECVTFKLLNGHVHG